MEIIKLLLVSFLTISISACVDLHGDWYNNDYASHEEQWVHPTLDKKLAEDVATHCSDNALEKTFGIKDYSKLTVNKQDNILKTINSLENQKISKQSTVIQEQCLLDKGFKFYPRGIKNNHPTVCFGDSKAMPSCRSAGY